MACISCQRCSIFQHWIAVAIFFKFSTCWNEWQKIFRLPQRNDTFRGKCQTTGVYQAQKTTVGECNMVLYASACNAIAINSTKIKHCCCEKVYSNSLYPVQFTISLGRQVSKKSGLASPTTTFITSQTNSNMASPMRYLQQHNHKYLVDFCHDHSVPNICGTQR